MLPLVPYTTSPSCAANTAGALAEVPSAAVCASAGVLKFLSLTSKNRMNIVVRISTTPKLAQAMKPGLNSGDSAVLHTASVYQIWLI